MAGQTGELARADPARRFGDDVAARAERPRRRRRAAARSRFTPSGKGIGRRGGAAIGQRQIRREQRGCDDDCGQFCFQHFTPFQRQTNSPPRLRAAYAYDLPSVRLLGLRLLTVVQSDDDQRNAKTLVLYERPAYYLRMCRQCEPRQNHFCCSAPRILWSTIAWRTAPGATAAKTATALIVAMGDSAVVAQMA